VEGLSSSSTVLASSSLALDRCSHASGVAHSHTLAVDGTHPLTVGSLPRKRLAEGPIVVLLAPALGSLYGAGRAVIAVHLALHVLLLAGPAVVGLPAELSGFGLGDGLHFSVLGTAARWRGDRLRLPLTRRGGLVCVAAKWCVRRAPRQHSPFEELIASPLRQFARTIGKEVWGRAVSKIGPLGRVLPGAAVLLGAALASKSVGRTLSR
jgi:hypothetical protein